MQKLRFSRYFKGIIILLDIFVMAMIFLFFFRERLANQNFIIVDWEQNIFSIILLGLFWILLSGRTKLYDIPRNLTYTLFLERFLLHIVIFLLGIILLGKVSNNDFLKTERFSLGIILFMVLFFVKSFIYFALKYVRSMGVNYRNIMFLDSEADSLKILSDILKQRTDYGYRIIDYPHEVIKLNELRDFWKEKEIYAVYMPTESKKIDKQLEQNIFRIAEINRVRVSLVPSIRKDNFLKFDLNYVETQPILSPSKFPLDFFTNFFIKRIFDVFFSLIILVFLCSWLFPLIALIIKMDSKGPVFFKQKRYGYHEEIFNCLKFRTMVVNEYSSTKTTKINDDRITKVGKFLRKTSLDELPQFINVLKGEMSVVGPRPHMLIVDDMYKPTIGRYAIRSLVKPGITGLAQVSGLRGDVDDMEIEMQKRALADAFYVKNWSFIQDVVIILKTVFLVISGDKNAR